MTSFRRILVPIDFSKHSERAVHLAAQLARRYEGSLDLVHVYDPIAYPLPDGYVTFTRQQLDQLFAEFDRQLAAMKQLATADGVSRVETHLRQGSCAADICEFAGQGAFDLIVMGTHGRSGLSHFLLGSVAERVLRTAPCPVLTVKDETTARSPREVKSAAAPPCS